MRELTKAQRLLLRETAFLGERESGNRYSDGTACVPQYRPAQALVAKGLAQWKNHDPESNRLIATDAGRALLARETTDEVNRLPATGSGE